MISGSRFGLSLTLNIEQYEYMRGPQSDAGIKVGICIVKMEMNWELIQNTLCINADVPPLESRTSSGQRSWLRYCPWHSLFGSHQTQWGKCTEVKYFVLQRLNGNRLRISLLLGVIVPKDLSISLINTFILGAWGNVRLLELSKSVIAVTLTCQGILKVRVLRFTALLLYTQECFAFAENPPVCNLDKYFSCVIPHISK